MRFVLIGNHGSEWVLSKAEERRLSSMEKCSELGLKVEFNAFTQGQYDFVTVIDALDPETVSAFSLWFNEKGFGRIQTMRAFDAEEFKTVLARAGRPSA
ncbi:GYD domain-containing protein [Rhizobium laguerreae]|nr:GYD domain-containing protein [Rhizobium laguerreae]